MAKKTQPRVRELTPLQKAPTGIPGLDEITGGGLPKAAPPSFAAAPAAARPCWESSFSSAAPSQFDEPGVLMAFEETPEEMAKNVASLGFDLEDLAAKKKLFLDYVYVEPSEIQETGDYDLEGLFHSPAKCRGDDRRQARDVRHRGSSFQRLFQSRAFCAPNFAGCSAGSRNAGSPPSSRRRGAKALSPATASRNTFPTA